MSSADATRRILRRGPGTSDSKALATPSLTLSTSLRNSFRMVSRDHKSMLPRALSILKTKIAPAMEKMLLAKSEMLRTTME